MQLSPNDRPFPFKITYQGPNSGPFTNEFAVAILNSTKGIVDVRMKAIWFLPFEHGDTNMGIHSSRCTARPG